MRGPFNYDQSYCRQGLGPSGKASSSSAIFTLTFYLKGSTFA